MKKGYKQTVEHIAKRAKSRQRGSFGNCLECGSVFWIKPSVAKKGDGKFCCKQCYFQYQVGVSKGKGKAGLKKEKNPKWKGGITPINKLLRNSREAKEWRLSVFKRDDWKCQKCGSRSCKNNYVRIEAHHIKPFATFPEIRFEITNGMTLCKSCHDKEPKGREIYEIK